jgi:hypothetical protein
MKRNNTFNSKRIQWLMFACLTFCFTFFMVMVSSCSDDDPEEVYNQAHYQDVPASLLTDAKKLEMVRSIQDLKDGRFFYLDYTEDYKLPTISGFNLTDNTHLIGAVLKTLCDKTPSWLKARVKLDAGCSAFAVTTPDTGDYLMGRNFDYSHDNEPIAAALVRTAPEGGLKSISMVDAYWIGYRQDLWHYILYNKAEFEKNKTQDLSYIMTFPYLLMDGMNEAGFAVSVLHLDGKPTQQASTGKKLTTTVALRMMLDHARTVDEALKILDGYDLWIPDNDGNYHFYMAYYEGLDSLCLDDEKSMGYTLRTLGAALWAYWHATSYKEGILKIVLSGGDADTNAAVAGAILGAKFGIDQIPEEWKSGLLYASMLHNKVQDLYFYNHRHSRKVSLMTKNGNV